MKKHELPDYLIISFLKHVYKIIEHVDDKSSSIADAVRLTKKEMKRIEGLMKNNGV